MSNPPKRRPSYQTPLERRPKYLRALGTITVELGNLEFVLAEVLGALLDIKREYAHAIYFAPKNTIARVDIIQAVLNEMPSSQLRDDVGSMLGSAKNVMQRRHDYIHKLWVLSESNRRVHTSKAPLKAGTAKYVPLRDLLALVTDMRKVVTTAHEMAPSIHESLHLRPEPLTPSSKKERPKKPPSRRP